ncbi:MAG: hypothetical protein U5L72_05325 [Bacteroidales bacterium]|nr:hypothetical protein [Bacteroidales bacterium]
MPAEGKLIPFNLKLSFYIGAVVLMLAVLWTVIRTREYSPEELDEFEKGEKIARGELIPEEKRPSSATDAIEAKADNISTKDGKSINFYRPGIIWLSVGLVLTLILSRADLEKELYVVTGGVAFFGLLQILAGALKSAGKAGGGLNSILTDLKNMPATMQLQLVVQVYACSPFFSSDLRNISRHITGIRHLRHNITGI